MKLLKGIIAVILGVIVNWLYGALTCGKYFNWVYKSEPFSIWRMPASPEEMKMYFLKLILAGIITITLFTIVYAVIYKGVPGKGIGKGLMYGFLVWFVAVIPGMAITYATMMISKTTVIYLTITGLVRNLLLGIVVSAVFGKSLES